MLKSTKLKNTLIACTTILFVSCSGQKEIKMGTYAYDARFLKEHGIEYKELVSADGNSKVMLIPAWQGRVMTLLLLVMRAIVMVGLIIVS